MPRYLFSATLLAGLGAGVLFASSPVPVLGHSADDEFERKCTAIARMSFDDVTEAPTRVILSQIVERAERQVCEIEGYVHPNARFTLRVPRDWNNRLYFRGCGGFCGEVPIDHANTALVRGYATVATDMGHTSTAFDALWAHDNPSAEVDFAYRATHRTAIAAKHLVAQLYERPRISIFEGCSTGGRQGLISSTRHPEDFDAIIAGAPVQNYLQGTGLQLLWSSMVGTGQVTGLSIDAGDVRILADHVRAKCDMLDGATDGVIAEPRKCKIDWAGPICGSNGQCLPPQAKAAAKAIYEGPKHLVGANVLRGPEAGSEENWIGTYVADDARPAAYWPFMQQLWRHLAFEEDPPLGWSPVPEELEHYYDRAATRHALFSPTANISAFVRRGGKLLIYHGWRDQSVVPQSTLDYGTQLAAAGTDASAYRVFMVPGLNHCFGGVGPRMVDWLRTMEDWLESGVPPDTVSAYNSTSSRTGEQSHEIALQQTIIRATQF